MPRSVSASVLEPREAQERPTDIAALRAIAQATVNVELFTVPLYMGTLYSIQGMHPITGEGEDFYQCRLWPGPATAADPQTDNERAFNIIFSVFIEEMLHIQMAANIASALGVTPTFTSPALQNPDHGWVCYGPKKTIIPHIVDLTDTNDYSDVRVNIAELSADQVKLFMAIEEPKEEAEKKIKETAKGKYFPTVPFKDWTPERVEKDLPMFGSIGHMYQCYYDYMNLRYEDNPKKKLWDYVFTSKSRQNDLFNVGKKSHPRREFCGFETTVTGIGIDPTNSDEAFARAVAMMDAITDQGEGSELKKKEQWGLAKVVKDRYQASREALQIDYPRYTDSGEPTESADAEARYDNGGRDHYERFDDLGTFVDKVTTWPQWHKKREEQYPSQHWQAADLQRENCTPVNSYGLPSTEAIAAAMNRIGNETDGEYYDKISKAAVGSIAGITTVLNNYWNPDAKGGGSFPYPSMVGSGDRMAICWALFGTAPDLSRGVGTVKLSTLYHACQGLDLANVPNSVNECAAVEIFHSCRGSNGCKTQGGCGFVQKITGGGECGFALVAAKTTDSNTGDGDMFSAPSDNKCAGLGGCAVPISASQILPQDGTMALYDFKFSTNEPLLFGMMRFTKGEKVYDVAYRAYKQVMSNRGKTAPTPPAVNDLRLVFPPST